MNVLAKIDALRISRNWTYYKLAEESGVTQSTIANMFARQSTPSIATLSCFCNAFGITLAEFFCENKNDSDNEIILLNIFRNLSQKDKKTVINLAKYLAENE